MKYLSLQEKPQIIRLHDTFCEVCLLEKGYSKNTIQCYKYSLNSLLSSFPNLSKVHLITENLIRQFFYQGRKERNWTNSTILHHRKNLSPFFQWCVKQGHLIENPLKNIEKPKAESKLPEVYSDEEIEKILYYLREYPYRSEFLRKRNYAIFALFLMAGVRKGELLGVKVNHINWEEGLLTVKAITSKSKRDRLIPMSQRLKEILWDYVMERKKRNESSLFLFTSLSKDMGLTAHGLKHLFDKLKRETGIHIHAHKFRHTFATKSLESNIEINNVKDLLGHKDIRTTAIYLHSTVKHLKKEIEKNNINILL